MVLAYHFNRHLIFKYALILLLCIHINLNHASVVKKYDIFTATDKTKWIQVSQLEQIFLSIEESLGEMKEKQKQDTNSISQVLNNLQLLNHRVQNIEDQLTRIERAELYNKMHLQQSADSSIKEELLIDQLTNRIEKNQQQINNRLNDINSDLEKISKTQDILEKELGKINTSQNKLQTNFEELNENSKSESTKIFQNLTSIQQDFQQGLKEIIRNTSNHEETLRIIKCQEQSPNKNNVVTTKPNQNDILEPDLSRLIYNAYGKNTDLRKQIQSVETYAQECTGITNKIYAKMEDEKDEMTNYLENYFNSLLNKQQQYDNSLVLLEVKLKENFEVIMNEQNRFKNDCHRLQLNEEQMEDKAVEILEKLFSYIDNRTDDMLQKIENLSYYDQIQTMNHSQQMENLKTILLVENEQTTDIFQTSNIYMLGLKKNFTELQKNVTRMESTINKMDTNIQDLKIYMKHLNHTNKLLKTNITEVSSNNHNSTKSNGTQTENQHTINTKYDNNLLVEILVQNEKITENVTGSTETTIQNEDANMSSNAGSDINF